MTLLAGNSVLYPHLSKTQGSLDGPVYLVGNDKPVDDFVAGPAQELVQIDLYGDAPAGA